MIINCGVCGAKDVSMFHRCGAGPTAIVDGSTITAGTYGELRQKLDARTPGLSTVADALVTEMQRGQSQDRAPLTEKQANAIEEEMRRLEADPSVDKRQLRLFMQLPMPCGHAVGNLLTCPTPPFGCVICNEVSK